MDALDTEKPWFYESSGQRKGGFSEQEMLGLISSGEISHDTAVWRKGLANWTKLKLTELNTHLDNSSPPPLSGEFINNTVVWVLAFAPLIGLILEALVAGFIHDGSEYRIQKALREGQFFYITLILNIGLSYWDEHTLKKYGVSTDKFKGVVWLIPVYLFQRAKALEHNLAYFSVWITSFFLMLTVFI